MHPFYVTLIPIFPLYLFHLRLFNFTLLPVCNILHLYMLFLWNVHPLHNLLLYVSESVYVVCLNLQRYSSLPPCSLSVAAIFFHKAAYTLKIINDICMLASLCYLRDNWHHQKSPYHQPLVPLPPSFFLGCFFLVACCVVNGIMMFCT